MLATGDPVDRTSLLRRVAIGRKIPMEIYLAIFDGLLLYTVGYL